VRLNQSIVAANSFEKHLINRRRKKNRGMRSPQFILMLTSMVDMFSMLVIFLLQTFSNSPEVSIVKGMQLPKSMTAAIVREAPVLAISKDGNLYLDQKLVGKTGDVTKKPDQLLGKLNFIKKGWVTAHQTAFTGDINLQADREVDSATVSMVMAILTTSQFQSIQLAVIGK
jgi:biopolymer transport protein ExbD